VAGGLELLVGGRTENVDTGLDVLFLDVLVLIAIAVLVLVLVGLVAVLVHRLLDLAGPPGCLEPPFPSPSCIEVVSVLPSQYSTHSPNVTLFMAVLSPVIPD
jgi:hypothetical protein